jgi:glycosyltransferase involved in cell wall biosynthesis
MTLSVCTPTPLRLPRIGYVPYSSTLERPGDRRRFVQYARRRNLDFEIADPDKQYDLVVLSECADISVWGRYPHGKIVYDLIDSYLAIPRSDLKGLLRGTAKFLSRQSRYFQFDHWKALAAMCRRADAVICSTEEQSKDIARYNTNVHIVLDIHSSVTHRVKTDFSAHQPFRLVWEGLPQTMGSLNQIKPTLDILRKRHPLALHLVTDPEHYRYLGRYGKANTLDVARGILPDVQLHEWKASDCADIICSCDLAVIPIPLDDPFAAGKPENKLLLLWRLGMPVVTSATPAYTRAMALAGLNLACIGQDQWIEAIERLICEEGERREAGTKGRAYAEEEVSEERLLARWDQVFSSIGFNFGSDLAHEPT